MKPWKLFRSSAYPLLIWSLGRPNRVMIKWPKCPAKCKHQAFTLPKIIACQSSQRKMFEKYEWNNTQIQIKLWISGALCVCRAQKAYTNTKIQIHKYKNDCASAARCVYAERRGHTQIHKYKYTNTQIQIHKYKNDCASGASAVCVCRAPRAAALLLVLRALQPPIFAR